MHWLDLCDGLVVNMAAEDDLGLQRRQTLLMKLTDHLSIPANVLLSASVGTLLAFAHALATFSFAEGSVPSEHLEALGWCILFQDTQLGMRTRGYHIST